MRMRRHLKSLLLIFEAQKRCGFRMLALHILEVFLIRLYHLTIARRARAIPVACYHLNVTLFSD